MSARPSLAEAAALLDRLGYPEHAAIVRAVKVNRGGRRPSEGPSQWTIDLANLHHAMLARIEAGDDRSAVVAAFMESEHRTIREARARTKDLEEYLHRLLTLEGFPAVRDYERECDRE